MTASEWIKELEETALESLSIDIEDIRESNSCPKCGGSGHIAIYDHVSGGICFSCNGTGKSHNTKSTKIAMKHILNTLPNLSKRQTWLVTLLRTNRTDWTRFDADNKDYDQLAKFGYVIKEVKGSYTYYTTTEQTYNLKINWL